MEHLSDESLITRYLRHNDMNAFNLVYQRHKDALFRFCLRQSRHHHLAEEIFQDIWSKLINASYQYTDKASFKTYLYTIARNRIIDHYRRVKPETEEYQDQDIDEAQTSVSNITNYDDILAVLDTLPLEQKEAFLLKAESELSFEEIAKVCACKPETAKSRYRYAIKKLSEQLGDML